MTDTLTISSPTETAERVLTFERPLIGFPGSRRFALRSLGTAYEPFAVLASLDEAGLEFIVVSPGVLFRDYVVEIPAPDVSALGLAGSAEVEILALVTRRGSAAPTANLLGPIVVNKLNDEAAQVVLQDSPYGVAVPVDAGSARVAA
jgi:flagellar assembly factor FliW